MDNEEFVFQDDIEFQNFEVNDHVKYLPEGPLITEEEEHEIRQVASDINEQAFYGKLLKTKQIISAGGKQKMDQI